MAGAHAVEVGTANFVNPRATEEIVDGISLYLKTNKISSLEQLRGSLILS